MADRAQGRLALEGVVGAASRLSQIGEAHWSVQRGWHDLLHGFWASNQGLDLLGFLRERLAAGAVVYPPEPLRAFSVSDPETVRVVVLGQDPYHRPGQAEGLAFSVSPGVRTPPSLRNIFKELRRDTGSTPPASGSLIRWAEQGVLLLNACLTVEEGRPASHAGQGWETLTDAVICHCSEVGPQKVFLLWGAHAQKKRHLIDDSRHLVLESNHPSPLSASRGPVPFVGCGHFGKANAWLVRQGRAPVNW